MKITELKAVLEKKKADFAVFYNSDSTSPNPNMFYFSGYNGLGALIVPRKQAPFLIAPEMEFQRAKTSAIKKVYSMEKKRFFESISKIVNKKKLKARSIAIDKSSFTLNAYRHFKKYFKKSKAKDISFNCIKLREIKTEKEISYLTKSCSYADKIVQKSINSFKDFKTESDAAAFLEYEAKKLGLGLSFNPIIASGTNGSMPHHEPSSAKIKKGFCVIDFGVKYKGYCSDITRTIYIGKPSANEKEIYNSLLAVQKNTISQIKENSKCSQLYDFVNKSLGSHGKYFTHGLGHGVGVEIHELPNLALNSNDKIMNNMVFTIEPGIYFPRKFGIRIEDTVLFKSKPIALTKTSKDLLIT
ncbi:aminopeptidase P family protein [Candidatus Woesearchaeota archaeon]|nr:aminopeptidase P family protein [Candidatus Woesearchaeota archaeon]